MTDTSLKYRQTEQREYKRRSYKSKDLKSIERGISRQETVIVNVLKSGFRNGGRDKERMSSRCGCSNGQIGTNILQRQRVKRGRWCDTTAEQGPLRTCCRIGVLSASHVCGDRCLSRRTCHRRNARRSISVSLMQRLRKSLNSSARRWCKARGDRSVLLQSDSGWHRSELKARGVSRRVQGWSRPDRRGYS